MKKLSFILSLVFILTLGLVSCQKEDEVINKKDFLPTKFSIDIPSSLSNSSQTKSTNADTLKGNEIYQHLRLFIAVGEGAAKITEKIISAIGENGLNQPMSFSYTSNDDGRVKNVVIIENAEFESKTWEYQMTIIDAESVDNADGGYAMEVFWNRSPINGVSIFKSYNINRTDTKMGQAIIRIDYDETGTSGYEQQMIVSIADLPLADPTVDRYSMNTLKMFVGKNGDIIKVYGNSNHPNAYLYLADNVGFNWAFVAAGDQVQNISVAEVGLPPSTLNSDDRTVILKDNSIKNVFTAKINAWIWQQLQVVLTPESLAGYLQNTEAPGFFNSNGFVSAGIAPSNSYSTLVSAIDLLTPYNPLTISNLKIEFKKETTTK